MSGAQLVPRKNCRDIDAWGRSVRADSCLGDGSKTVAWELADRMDWNGPNAGGNAFPSLSTLAAAVGRHEATVKRCLNELEARGYIDRRRGEGAPGRGGRTTLYLATLPLPENERGRSSAPSSMPADVRKGAQFRSKGGAIPFERGRSTAPQPSLPSQDPPVCGKPYDGEVTRYLCERVAETLGPALGYEPSITDKAIRQMASLLSWREIQPEHVEANIKWLPHDDFWWGKVKSIGMFCKRETFDALSVNRNDHERRNKPRPQGRGGVVL